LKIRERQNTPADAVPARTVGELRARAEEIRIASERAEAEREAAQGGGGGEDPPCAARLRRKTRRERLA
jgi:hypothetical protein